MKSFLAELRRRHVFRVAAWYAVVAWLVIQIATNTFPHLLLPDWSVRLVIVLCLIGFPVALALAWALEVTPEGLRVATPKSVESPAPAAPHWHGASLWLGLAGGVLLGIGALQSWRAMAPESVTEEVKRVPEKVSHRVLAVLPFDNLGGDEDNAAFTAGIHDSLITRIAKIGGMTVISRTSVMAYEGARPNLKDVARALGVTHVVEGSVQRAGDRVQIQAQLIDAATDTHLWAETYDRTLAEGFATQNEIATAISRELTVRLSDRERTELGSVPTKNARAFEQYVLGHAEVVRDDLPKAITHLQSAVELDPGFALAHAELSMALTTQAATFVESMQDQYEEKLAAARAAYEQALAMHPSLPEGVLARAVYRFRGAENFAEAEPDLTTATSLLPNNSLAFSYLSDLRMRQGRWRESTELGRRAMEIEPGNTHALRSFSYANFALRQLAPIEHAIDRAQAAGFNTTRNVIWKSYIRTMVDGDVADHVFTLERLYAQQPDDADIIEELGFWYWVQGRFQETANILEASSKELYWGGVPGVRAKHIGLSYWLAGDLAAARRWFEISLAQLDEFGPPKRRASLGLYQDFRAFNLAGLGRKDEAAAAMRELLAIAPRNMDEVVWASNTTNAYSIMLMMGDTQGATALIRQLLDPPTAWLPIEIWLNPFVAPLRANPEFRELLARHGVDVTRDPRAEYPAQQASADKSK